MKKLLGLFFAVAAVIAFAACASKSSGSTNGPDDYENVEAKHFPLIKIVSTENGGNSDFVLSPVAKHVKEAQQSWGDFSKAQAPDPWYEKCQIWEDDTDKGAAEVKVRGNWTTNYDKKSLRIKFAKGNNQNLGGIHEGAAYKNWVLLAAYKDASLLRDAVAFQMYRKMFTGYASDCRLVEVEVNGMNMGVYLLAEQQEAERMGLTEPEKKATNTDIGYLIEFDDYYYTEDETFQMDYVGPVKDYDGTVLEGIQAGYTIKSDITDKAQNAFISGYMNKLWKICYEAVYNKKYYKFNSSYELVQFTPEGADDNAKCYDCVSRVLDLGSLADMYIFNELICDPDLYLTSFFMNIDFAPGKDQKLHFEAPWDFDSTMGNKSFAIESTRNENMDKINMSTIDQMFAGLCQTDVNCWDPKTHGNPWMVIFIRQAWFQDMVKEHWSAIDKDGVLSYLQGYIDEYSAPEYQSVFNYTRTRWGIPAGDPELCRSSQRAALKSQAASATYLKDWLTTRFAATDAIIAGLTPQ
ncbi:MAG: CotH kinase family protein [Treponema sp.]|nr:CotH kinase family protein [Treponema sp.]